MKKGMIIVMADENLKDHDAVKKAMRDCNVNHVFTSVFNGSQLGDLLFKRGVYKTSEDVYPDLVIMDVTLPVINGLEVLDMVRDHPRLMKIPFYILTADKEKENRIQALKKGAAGFFTKPLLYTELQQIVNGICEATFRKP